MVSPGSAIKGNARQFGVSFLCSHYVAEKRSKASVSVGDFIDMKQLLNYRMEKERRQ